MEIYLDESGDLGWILDKPYQRGGSSRFLVITALILPTRLSHHPERLLRHFYKHRKWNTSREKKWADMSTQARSAFVTQAVSLLTHHPEISCRSIVAEKSRLPAQVRSAPEVLYNFMTKQLLLDVIGSFQSVALFPDQRSLKTGSEGSLHEYLLAELWLGKGASTILTTTPMDSQHSLNLQFADMLSGVVHSAFEFGRRELLRPLDHLLPIQQVAAPG